MTPLLTTRMPVLLTLLQKTRIVTALLFALTMIASPTAQGQAFAVIYNFNGGADGATPYAGLTMDRAENLYGTTNRGGSGDLGTVYRLRRSGSNWILDSLYKFRSASDGTLPLARVIFGPDGSLYGTASLGAGNQCGTPLGCGVVFQLQPPLTFCRSVSCPWTETVLLKFGESRSDGGNPSGDLVFDAAGNLYGTAQSGGAGYGVLYELTHSGSGWTETVLHDFSFSDGTSPAGGLASDSAGNLYGTTSSQGSGGFGTVFQFTHSGSDWTENVLYNFTQNPGAGQNPTAGIFVDPAGTLYGATSYAGSSNGGTAFELSPSGGGWTYNVLYGFRGSRSNNCPDPLYQNGGSGPYAALTMDAAGNLYGTTLCDGANQQGNVFKLTRSGDSWTYTSLHDFSGGADGAYPLSNVTIDASGNLYGTASAGGSQGKGVVWEITP